jgi:ABC-type nitrate/sulfonate/bicarbonate transport system substrate-binding protein
LRIGLPDLVSNSYFPAIAAVDLGFLDASIELIFPVTHTYAALREGHLDFVAGNAHALLSAFPRWRGAKLLAALAQHTYWLLVLRSDLGARRGDVERVRGLRIGAAPGVDVALRRLLLDTGIDPDRDQVNIAPVPGTAGADVSFGVAAARALEAGLIDGLWANGMGAEVSVRRGVGTVVLDVRRGDGPPAARDYTFAALVTTEARLAHEPASAVAAVQALVRAQRALRADPSLATTIGRRRFPKLEAELIADLVRRDAPFYDPSISPASIDSLVAFAQAVGILDAPVDFEEVVATQLIPVWRS